MLQCMQSVSPEKNKYVTASDASEASTLGLGGLGVHSEPTHQRIQGRPLVRVQGVKSPRNFAFLILKIS